MNKNYSLNDEDVSAIIAALAHYHGFKNELAKTETTDVGMMAQLTAAQRALEAQRKMRA